MHQLQVALKLAQRPESLRKLLRQVHAGQREYEETMEPLSRTACDSAAAAMGSPAAALRTAAHDFFEQPALRFVAR